MTSFKISLNKSKIEGISFCKYIKDSVFIVDEKLYETSRIIEEILTTTITKNDEKIDENAASIKYKAKDKRSNIYMCK